MHILFETIKLIFFLSTILISLLHIKGEEIMSEAQVNSIIHLALPAYLLLCGLMVGYILGLAFMGRDHPHRSSTWGFILGLLIGIGAAVFYIFAV